MSDDAKYLLFFVSLWGAGLGAWLWVRWKLAKDAAAEHAAREAWALVTPRDGCTRSIPGCICARDNLGEWCVHRRADSKTPNVGGEATATARGNR